MDSGYIVCDLRFNVYVKNHIQSLFKFYILLCPHQPPEVASELFTPSQPLDAQMNHFLLSKEPQKNTVWPALALSDSPLRSATLNPKAPT